MSFDVATDLSQWLAVNEETLFLNDGIIRVSDLIDLPKNVICTTDQESELEVITFNTKSPIELTQRILSICGSSNNAYSRLFEYRLSAVLGLWKAHRLLAVEQNGRTTSINNEETIALLKQQGLLQQGEHDSFSLRVSLLLVYPLLQSQSKIDPSLCSQTTILLFNCLQDCAPLSLSKEPSDCHNGLENLLSGWLGEVTSTNQNELNEIDESKAQIQNSKDRENAASALVALACARGSMKTFIHTIHLLQKLPDVSSLPVASILRKLLNLQGGFSYPSALLGTKHILSWGFEDLLCNIAGSNNDTTASERDFDSGKSITCDDRFIYTTNSFGMGISKIGNGLNGSLRGYVYMKNLKIGPGWLAKVNGKLLFRPYAYDDQNINMADILDSSTLEIVSLMTKPTEEELDKGTVTTIQFCSDGRYLYWIWCSVQEKATKVPTPIYVNVYKVQDASNELIVIRRRLLLLKKDESLTKNANESLLAKLRPFRSSAAAQHASNNALASGAFSNLSSQEMSSLSSCGIPLKSLFRVPIYVCGSFIVIVTTVIGSGNSSNRSLFGSSSTISGLRALATNLTFSLNNGQFVARNDLTDAPTTSLARGAPLHNLGICYDFHNNMIWTCSNDYIDQYLNPGHQALHHIHKRMCIKETTILSEDRLSPADVIRMLLEHVGSMCCHHLSCDFLQTPLGTLLLQQQQPLDFSHLARILDILELATRANDEKAICCILIILQVIFKTFLFAKNCSEQLRLMNKLSSMVWLLLSPGAYSFEAEPLNSNSHYGIQAEACRVITCGLDVLYPTSEDKKKLILSLINCDNNKPQKYLLELILCDIADFLQFSQHPDEELNEISNYALSDKLIGSLLELSVQEWMTSIKILCLTNDRTEFDSIMLNTPVCSPSLRYLSAYQNYLMKKAVLHNAKIFRQSNTHLYDAIKSYSELVFESALKILEILKKLIGNILSENTCTEILNPCYRLQGVNRLIKSSIVGLLLPILGTCLMHENIRCLQLSESSLMPKLVKLVISSCEMLFQMKSISNRFSMDQDVTLRHDDDYLVNSDLLTGLKIPTPWSTGRIVESIHPVRDNYKFKETVQIPGARCLYLRFDPRCSSQYDYDKLMIYAGPNTNHRKAAEFGGNTIGYGSRSVLGSGWPKDSLKIDGDTVTFSFEMRSGREHNTPDKALWGFLVTVRAQENTQDISVGLPFIPDLILLLSILVCDMLKLLYNGCDITDNEKNCFHLLQSHLLQNCMWSSSKNSDAILRAHRRLSNCQNYETLESNVSKFTSPDIFLLQTETLKALRSLSAQITPQCRPSICKVIKPELVEKQIISAVVKHLGIQDLVSNLPKLKQNSAKFKMLKSVIVEAYKRTDALIRQLQILSELEQKWHTELEDIRKGLMPAYMSFFAMHHLLESQVKEVSLLCFLKGVTFEPNNLESVINSLREKMEEEASVEVMEGTSDTDVMPKTREIVATLIERANLLLLLDIDHEKLLLQKPLQKSTEPESGVSYRNIYGRSLSAPPQLCEDDTSNQSLFPTHNESKQMSVSLNGSLLGSKMNSECKDINENEDDKFYVLDQILFFISKLMDKNASCDEFLLAVKTRNMRAKLRHNALVQMNYLLSAVSKVNCSAHFVTAITSILQNGPKVDELTCSGMIGDVNEAFANAMTCVVEVAKKNPFACYNGIGLLCTIPFNKNEEKCLVNSGLVHLLDRLCGLNNYHNDAILASGNVDKQSIQQKVSALAWAGFQVLSNRCVMWETDDKYSKGCNEENTNNFGLASQVATLLTNHLARATENSTNEAAGNEALQEVLTLLNNLSVSCLGQAILSQPTCVSKLLSLLVDHRPSPKLVLVILQLCRFALPLMSMEDCDKVTVPKWNSKPIETPDSPMDTASKIIRLLISKLGDFLTPGYQTSLSRRSSKIKLQKRQESGSSMECIEEIMIDDEQNSQADDSTDSTPEQNVSIFLHKRDDQSAHEVIQLLLSSADGHLFRLNGNTNLERIVHIDKEMSKNGKAIICTESVRSGIRKSLKWALLGLVLSTTAPVNTTISSLEDTNSDKKKSASEVHCKEKNFELAKTDPVRPFISGNVANSMASEIITLLHSLLSVPQTNNTSHFWTSAIVNVLNGALNELSKVLKTANEFENLTQINLYNLMIKSKQILASLCVLGGFKDTIKPGSEVTINGAGIHQSEGKVVSISEADGLAMVKLKLPANDKSYPRASDVVEVAICRLSPPNNKIFCVENTPLLEQLVSTVQMLVTSANSTSFSDALARHIGSSLSMAVARVLAEIQTRASIVLNQYLQFDYFSHAFIKDSSSAINILKSMSKECVKGDRLNQVENRCQKLRMLYRDCVKPPAPPSKASKKSSDICWDISRLYPPVRSCLFTNNECGITFVGDPSVSSGFPRGIFVYASKLVPSAAPSFYYEIEILSFGELQDDNGPAVSFGFAPAAEKRDGAWTYPVGTVLFHNNGRAVHYNGSSLLQWKSVRLNISLAPGDIIGCGWERTSDILNSSNEVKGLVFFTFNGLRFPSILDDVVGGMFPVVHVQKKNTRIRSNFGLQIFKYTKGNQYRFYSKKISECAESSAAEFDGLPFDSLSDFEFENTILPNETVSINTEPADLMEAIPCIVPQNPKPRKEYNAENGLLYKHSTCLNKMLTIGSDPKISKIKDDDQSDDEEDLFQEDYHSMLVKVWESKVFPVIRRRFRNEAERKDGLEQIRGALQLGMTDIARQTVEFLYEENGGIPRDLYLPTLEDMKEEAAKFTIGEVSKGIAVLIRDQATIQNSSGMTSGTTLLPKFAVHSMLKTFGLIGVVLEVDLQHELILVETYLQSEGVLVQYWYPIEAIEKPPHGSRKPTVIGSQTIDARNTQIHKALLHCEQSLTKIYCRSGLLKLISLCNAADDWNNLDCLSSLACSSSMASCAVLLQELDIENLQLLSDECLANSTPRGDTLETNVNTCTSTYQCLLSLSLSPNDLFYSDMTRLALELASAIKRATCQGEGCVIELTNQICTILQLAPENFLSEEIIVTKDDVATDVSFPGSCCVFISCKVEPNCKNKRTLSHKNPFAKVYCYNGSKVKKDGTMSKNEIVYYPFDAPSSSTNTGSSCTSDHFPSFIIPCDKLFVKCGSNPPPGILLCLHGVPSQLPLALCYIEQLLLFKHKELANDSVYDENSLTAITVAVLLNVVELLGGYILRTEIPILLKERIFHLLAEVLRTLHLTAAHSHKSSHGLQEEQPVFFPPSLPLGSHIGPSLSILIQLQNELRNLYREETKQWTPNSSGSNENGFFTNYFQSLMEVCMAISEVTTPSAYAPLPALPPFNSSSSNDAGNSFSFGSLMSSLVGDYAQAASSGILAVTLNAPPSPSLSKRKKLKAKRDNDKSTQKSQSGSSSPRSSDIEVYSNGNGMGSVLSPGKTEDSVWFQKSVTVSRILRYLVLNDSQGYEVMEKVVCEACQELSTTTSHLRLLVIKGIPKYITQEQAKNAIVKALRSCGGLYRNEVYVPSAIETHYSDSDEPTEERHIKGHAVIELRLSSKADLAMSALLKNKSYFCDLSTKEHLAVDEIMNLCEDFQVSTIDQNLQTSESRLQHILDEYFHQKLISQDVEIVDNALIALTEIFHSCFIAEHRLSLSDPKHESGYICLSQEQIMNPVQGNLLYTFLNTIKPQKQLFSEMVTQMLQNYGILKHIEKEVLAEEGDQFPLSTSSGEKSSFDRLTSNVGQKSLGKKSKSFKKSLDLSSKENVPSAAAVSEGSHFLTLDGFMQFVLHKAEDDGTIVWLAILACGYDIHCDRCCCIDNSQAIQMSRLWNLEMDCALVLYVNSFCRKMAVSPSVIHPHEIYLSKSELASSEYFILQDIPIESMRVRFKFLQTLNTNLDANFIPLINLNTHSFYPHNTASILSSMRGLMFHNSKLAMINKILNATTSRKSDQAAPEVILNPLEVIGCESNDVLKLQFCQAIRQLHQVPSSQLCVKPASGSDPMYAFNIRFTGEKVLGTSGSFRHFLSQISKELQGPLLDLFILCPSSAASRNKGKYLLKPGSMTFSEEQLLIALGQLFGISIRAEIPLPMDLLPVFWKTLIGIPVDDVSDFQDADFITFNYLKQFNTISKQADLGRIVEDHQQPTFTYTTIGGSFIELCENGAKRYVNWSNYKEYAAEIKKLRMSELNNCHRITAIKTGLASIVYLPTLSIMSTYDMEMRTCGIPDVDIEFLKAHTIYQSGLTETDNHIQYFWNALELFSQEEIRKFIKFACNQDRIPMTCSCTSDQTQGSLSQDGSSQPEINNAIVHVPPYPMKIAPPDAQPGHSADKRFIRVETCLFMIKLPQYTSQEALTEKLLFAIHCREDPLSG